MPPATARTRNWFDVGGEAYARFRPAYPRELADFLASLVRDRHLAVDVGCGNGQLTRLLAPHFSTVLGVDPSIDQVANASAHERIDFLCASAERIPVADGTASLIAAAQAAHWFDLPAFYVEVRRVAAPGAILALVSYGAPTLDASLDARFQRFHREEIGPWWPPERTLVDQGYRAIPFPFDEIDTPTMAIRVEWRLPELLGYMSTWSAVRGAREAGRDDLLTRFTRDIATPWGDPDVPRWITWPVNMRVGRI